jgi:hypothetical protein
VSGASVLDWQGGNRPTPDGLELYRPPTTAGSTAEWRRVEHDVAVLVAHMFAAVHPGATHADPDNAPRELLVRDDEGRWIRFRVSVECLDGRPW